MSHSSYSIAFLSANEEVYQRLHLLLQQTRVSLFNLAWIDLTEAPLLEDLPRYDAYLSDAPLLYLIQQSDFVAQRPFFWITETDSVRHEILHWGVLDCFLTTELTSSLLEHSLRICLRQTQSVTEEQCLLTEFEGDRFQTLVQNIPGVVYRCLYTQEWHGMYVSEAIEDLVGYPAADFSASGDRTLASVIHPSDRDFVERIVEQSIQAKQPFNLEYRLVHRDGTIKWIDERGQGVFDELGNLLWIDGVIIDISEKKAIANELNRQVLSSYEKTPAMLHSIDPSGRIIAVSDHWLKVMNYEREEVIGRQSSDFLTEQSRQYAISYAIPLFFEQGHIEDVEYQFVKKNGEIIDVLLSAIMEESGGMKRSLAVLTDVTNRNKLERELTRYQNRLQGLIAQRTQALANSERRMQTIFDCAPMGIVELDLDGHFRLANQKYADIVGCKLEDLIARRIQDFTHPDDLDTAATLLAELTAGEIPLSSLDKRCLRVDGSEIWIHVEMSLVRNGQGAAEYLIAIVDDIDQRKRMEESLRISEHRLAQAQAIANIGVWQWDIRANKTYWSEETFKIFGVPQGSIEPDAETFFQLLHPDDVAIAQDNIQRLFAGEHMPQSEYRIITPAGELRVLQDYHELIRDQQGEPIYISGAVQDITEMRQTMIALQESEARLAQSQAIAHLGHWEWNLVTNTLLWSDEFYRIFDLEPQASEPNFDTFIEMVHAGDRHRIEAAIEILKRGEKVYGFEYRITTAEGREKIVLEHVAPLYNDAGEVTHFSGTLQDITAFKQTLNALQASETRLAKSQAIAHVGSWEWDLATNRIIWSDETYRIFDFEPQSVEPSYDLVMGMVIPDDRPRLDAAMPVLMAGEKVHDLEYRIITPQGRHKTVIENAEPKFNEQGEITHFSGTLQDITAFKQTMLALQESETRLAKSQAIAHIGSWEWNFKTNKLSWSDEMFRLCDLEPQSIEPTYEGFIAMVAPNDVGKIQAMMERVWAGETLNQEALNQVEYHLISAAGNHKILLAIAEAHCNSMGEVEYVTGSAQDITAFRQATAALQASETRLAKSQEIAHVGSWEWNIATNELIWSDELFRLFDLEPHSVEPSFDFFLEMLDESDRPAVEAVMQKLNAGETIGHFEYKIISAQGRKKIFLTHATVTRNDQGEMTYFSGTTQDITTFKETLNALQESETRFRELVENIEESFWINPPDPTEVLYVSPAYEKIWGRSCQSLLDDGDTWIEAVHPDDRDRQIEALNKMAAGELFDEKYRIVRPDGEVRWVHARSAQVRDESGQLLRHLGSVRDITEIKEIELELRLSESRFRSMFDQAALGIVQIEMEGKFHVVNQAFSDLVGYTQAELAQMTWQQLTHPDDVQKCQPGFEQILSREAHSFNLEKRYIHKDGHVIWVKAIASFIYDENDQPQYLLALVEDITNYKQAAIALNESQSRYRELVEGIPAIIYQFSTKRQGIFYSSQLQQILGYEPEFLLQHPALWYDSIHLDDVHQVNEVFATLQAGKNFEVEYRIRDAAGKWRWFYDCSFSVKQVADDEIVIDGFAIDITARKSFDLALRHRLNLETVLADISHLMIVETDLDLTEVLTLLGQTFQADRMSVMLWENAAIFNRLKAWAATADLDLNLERLEISDYPWWLQQWQEQRRILLNRDRPLPEDAVAEREFLALLNVQAVMWMPIQDQQGNPWGYIECSSTDENHMLWSKEDADLLAIAGNLIYNYCDRQKARYQLETAKEAAEIANHAKNQFLTNMSHELRTPLNAILGFTQLMEQSKTLPDIHREHLAIVRRSGKHLLTLLNDILNLAKFERGTLTLNKTLFNLHALLEDLTHMYIFDMERKRLNFRVQWDDTIPRYITADQAKLHSVLIHLLSNALKFTDSGSVTMSVEAIAENPLKLRFTVSDTGIGIPDTELSKLFDNFVKLEAGDRLGQGSGLGLALSQKLVNLMGSEISVSSNLNQGSCFSFDLLCETTAQSLPMPTQYQMITDDSPITLNPRDLRELPITWREAFYHAALSARVKQLELLIRELPPESKAIANALNLLSRKLEFEKLAALSKPER